MPDYLTVRAREAIRVVTARTGLSRTEVINRAIIAYAASTRIKGAEPEPNVAHGDPRPRLPSADRTTGGKVVCNEPLYDFEGVAIVGYCERFVWPARRHRGRHRLSWHTSTRH